MKKLTTIAAILAVFATVVGGVWGLDARIESVTNRTVGERLGRIEQQLTDMQIDLQQIKNRFFRVSQKASMAR